MAEDEAVEAATAGKVAATMGDEPEEPKKKKLNKRQLYMELPQFLFFFLMFVTSLSTRRTVKDHFYQVRPRPISTPISTPISHGPPRPRPISCEQINAIRTALFEENFGDYNEKAFSDIGTPRAARTTAAHRAPRAKAHAHGEPLRLTRSAGRRLRTANFAEMFDWLEGVLYAPFAAPTPRTRAAPLRGCHSRTPGAVCLGAARQVSSRMKRTTARR